MKRIFLVLPLLFAVLTNSTASDKKALSVRCPRYAIKSAVLQQKVYSSYKKAKQIADSVYLSGYIYYYSSEQAYENAGNLGIYRSLNEKPPYNDTTLFYYLEATEVQEPRYEPDGVVTDSLRNPILFCSTTDILYSGAFVPLGDSVDVIIYQEYDDEGTAMMLEEDGQRVLCRFKCPFPIPQGTDTILLRKYIDRY
ncbi:MAG: hypothetical protein IJS49_00185 [Paludibacteraceae bacterium]|nr:hypothetical protein [Paludibacteraceae bacterium]